MTQAKSISPQDLICMNNHSNECHYRIDLVYAKNDNLLFGERIYNKDTRLWLYKDLAKIVMSAAKHCYHTYNMHFILYDGLRTYDAQEAMIKTQRIKNNPQWLETPRLLSKPGDGGHPRAMAIDIGLKRINGELLNMGCAFDFLAKDPSQDHNPAHRNYNHPKNIIKNREVLDNCMNIAAAKLSIELSPLPQEWWDYRLPSNIYEQYAPIYDCDLPDNMRQMT